MRFWLILAASLLACTLPAVDLQPEPIPGTEITIGLPLGWKPVLPLNGLLIRRRQPTSTAGVAVSVTSTSQGPAAFTQESLADLQRLAFDFDLIDWDFSRPVHGRTWSRLHFRFVIGEIRWEEQLWLTVDRGQAIAVAFTASPPDWQAWAPVFEAAIIGDGGSRPVLKR